MLHVIMATLSQGALKIIAAGRPGLSLGMTKQIQGLTHIFLFQISRRPFAIMPAMNSIPQRLIPIACLFLLAVVVPAWPQSADTAEVYATWRDRIVQIQVIDRQADSKAGIGSGFFAGQPGWIVTNYHVIAELVNEPGRYRSRYLAEGGKEGDLQLLAVDAVHDLALLKTDGFERKALALATNGPPKGTRLWSLGYPFDIGLTIVEGTYNGRMEKSLYEKLHFTGSINPGMSGGPTLNDNGEVVGINVSTAGNQVSFLVPVHYVAQLLSSVGGGPVSEESLNQSVADQLLDNQQQILDRLFADAVPVTRLNGYSAPAGLASFINCWGNSSEDEENNLSFVLYRCQSNDDIYLSTSLKTGIIRYQHELISTDSLGAMRFYRQLEKRGYYPRLRLDGDEKSVSNYKCQDGFVDQATLPLKVTYCVRSYRKLAGLYDGFLSTTSLVDNREALQSTLVLAGFSWDNLNLFFTRFLDAYSWQP